MPRSSPAIPIRQYLSDLAARLETQRELRSVREGIASAALDILGQTERNFNSIHHALISATLDILESEGWADDLGRAIKGLEMAVDEWPASMPCRPESRKRWTSLRNRALNLGAKERQ